MRPCAPAPSGGRPTRGRAPQWKRDRRPSRFNHADPSLGQLITKRDPKRRDCNENYEVDNCCILGTTMTTRSAMSDARETAVAEGWENPMDEASPARVPEPAVAIERAEAPSPIVLVCDHASNHLPARYGSLGLTADDLLKHFAWDPGALAVSRRLSALLDAPLVYGCVSRLALDVNRHPSDVDLIVETADGVLVPGNSRPFGRRARASRRRNLRALPRGDRGSAGEEGAAGSAQRAGRDSHLYAESARGRQALALRRDFCFGFSVGRGARQGPAGRGRARRRRQ